MGNQDAPQAPAGWYPIDTVQPGERYWDGKEWTGETRGDSENTSKITDSSGSNKRNKILITLGVLSIPLALLFSFLMGGSQTYSFIPEVKGLTSEEAISILEAEGFEVEVELIAPLIGEKADVVLGTSPLEGESVKSGSLVTLKISDGTGAKSDTGESDPGNSQWMPSGFSEYGQDLAFRWVTDAPPPNCGPKCKYFTIEITSKYGCPSGVYVELNITSNGTVVDWTNDSLPALNSGQLGQLQFITYDQNADSGQIVTMTCR